MLKGFLRRMVERDRKRRRKLEEIVKRYDVTAVLFGSRARGDATPASDYDLLLIYEDPSTLERLLEDLREARIPVDVHSFTPEEALEVLPYSTVILDALTEGIVLKENLPLKPLTEKLKSLRRRGYRKVEGGWIIR